MDTLRILLEELTPSWLQRARHQGETRGLPAGDAHQLALEADQAWAQCLTHGLYGPHRCAAKAEVDR